MPKRKRELTFTFVDSNAPGALEELLHRLALERLLPRQWEPEARGEEAQ